nr:succinate dehydrogenase cytochrome b subunit [Naumannella cuiyingiana]
MTVHQRAARSLVVSKYVMAITGLIMLLFLIGHMLGNLKLFAGAEEFNHYAEGLRTLGEPILPYSAGLWAIRPVLLLAVILHIVSAVRLTQRDRAAVGPGRRYVSTQHRTGVQRTYASFTMRWGGLTIALFVIYHLLQFTLLPKLVLDPATNGAFPGSGLADPYVRTVTAFTVWWVVLIYAAAIVALGMHLRHGIYSAVATLGGIRTPRARTRALAWSAGIALVLSLGFLIPPFACLFGVVQP